MLLSIFFGLFLAQPAISQSSNLSCSCFLTNGSSPEYFTSHSFFDFRNVQTNYFSIPPLLTNTTNTTNAPATSEFLRSDDFSSSWALENWNNSDTIGTSGSDATVPMFNSPNNVYIESLIEKSPRYSTYLTLRTARLPTFQSAAEIDSIAQNYHYLSMRVLARVQGSPGACAGVFTYRPSAIPQDVQEADIEILTSRSRDMVQYTNQPSESAAGDIQPQATANVTNPGQADWTNWLVYRVDWIPGKMTWYVNGETTAEIRFQAPKDPSGVILNIWSDGGSWTGNMSIYDEAYLQVQWIEMVYNTSGPVSGSEKRGQDSIWAHKRSSKGCKTVCSIDENVSVIGSPVLWNGTEVVKNGTGTTRAGALAWILVVLTCVAML